MAEKTLRLRIEGRVQGVGFRDFTQRTARALGLRGWVRNRRDGSVEALTSGEAEALEAFIARCRQGPSGARVARIDVEASTEKAGAAFEIRPTH